MHPHGTPSPPSPLTPQPDDDRPGPSRPNPSGRLLPSSPAINVVPMGGGKKGTDTTIPLAKRQSCGGESIVFDTSTVFHSDTAAGSMPGSASEPSGAKSGKSFSPLAIGSPQSLSMVEPRSTP
ncbi:hypothetical protein FNYG_03802 [Fusarium nygamai]|uniref:Uncharacterized protein n=1 Tax=Gibberella nygamai TaxID=42673 RepID=A0A2K0WKX9_GIBNY|nr:hypothetical protein FNYG_03802 [Fusarium nygamai]